MGQLCSMIVQCFDKFVNVIDNCLNGSVYYAHNFALGIAYLVSKGIPVTREMFVTTRHSILMREVEILDAMWLKTPGTARSIDGKQASDGVITYYWLDNASNVYRSVFLERVTKEKPHAHVSYTIYTITQRSMDIFMDCMIRFAKRMYANPGNKFIVYDMAHQDITQHVFVPTTLQMKPINREQKVIVDFMLDKHAQNPHEAHSLLIAGLPGTGKSSIGPYIGKVYQELNPTADVMVVRGFNPALGGLDIFTHVLKQRNNPDNTLLVITLDEFDKSIQAAEEDNKKNFMAQSSHAKDKGELTRLLDILNNQRNCIVIGTTNKNLEDITALHGGVYTRSGRFSYHVTMTQVINNNQAAQQIHIPPPPQPQAQPQPQPQPVDVPISPAA